MKSNLFINKNLTKKSSIHKISLLAFCICFSIMNTGCQNTSSDSEKSDTSNSSINENAENAQGNSSSSSQSNTLRPNFDEENDKNTDRDNFIADGYAANSDNSNSFTKQDSAEFFKRFSPKTQTFVIDYDKDQHIFGKKGTHIFIEKSSFVFEDGTPVKSKINIEIKEFYDKKTILLAGLITQTKNGFLESGGMIHIQATADGKKVKLKKKISIEMPTSNTKASSQEDMKVYLASTNLNDPSLDKNSPLNPPKNWVSNGVSIQPTLPQRDYEKWKYLGKQLHVNSVQPDTVCHCVDASLVYEKIEPLSKSIAYKEDFTYEEKKPTFSKSQKNIEKFDKRQQRYFPLESPENMKVLGNAQQVVYEFYPTKKEEWYYYDTMEVAFEIDEFRTGTVVERMESTHNALKNYTTQASIRPNSGVFLTVEVGGKSICQQSKRRFFLQSMEAASKVLLEAEKYKNEWKRIQNGTQENYSLSYQKRDKAIMVWTGVVRISKAEYNNKNYYEGEGRTYQKYIDEALKRQFEVANKNYTDWLDDQVNNNPDFDEEKITNYTFKTKDMGWINCDRFLFVPAESKTNLIVKTDVPVTLVFEKLNSLMASSYHEKGVSFNLIPKNEKITLFSLKKKEGKLLMALQQTTIGNEPISLIYEEVTFSEMQRKLDYL